MRLQGIPTSRPSSTQHALLAPVSADEIEFDDFVYAVKEAGVVVQDGVDDTGNRFDKKLAEHCKVMLKKKDGTPVHPEDGLPGAPYIESTAHLKRVKLMCRMHIKEFNDMLKTP